VQAIAVDFVRPAASAIDRSARIPAELLAQLWRAGFVQGILETEPGVARSRILSCILLEELAWGDSAVATAIGATMSYVQAVMDHGTAEQKQDVQRSFAGADFRGAAVLIHEPGFAGNVGQLTTVAEPDDSGYLIRGAKAYVPLAGHCQEWLVLARCNGRPEAFMVSADCPGVRLEPAAGTLGLKGLSLATLHLDQVAVARGARLGGAAGCDTSRLIASARLGISAMLTGLSRAVFEHITAYSKERVAHGTALARKQSVAFRLADMFIDIPSMRWMCWRGAATLGRNEDARRAARLAHIHCADRSMWIADEGVQLMGGHGYIRSNPVERWYRDARTLSLLEGLTGV